MARFTALKLNLSEYKDSREALQPAQYLIKVRFIDLQGIRVNTNCFYRGVLIFTRRTRNPGALQHASYGKLIDTIYRGKRGRVVTVATV